MPWLLWWSPSLRAFWHALRFLHPAPWTVLRQLRTLSQQAGLQLMIETLHTCKTRGSLRRLINMFQDSKSILGIFQNLSEEHRNQKRKATWYACCTGSCCWLLLWHRQIQLLFYMLKIWQNLHEILAANAWCSRRQFSRIWLVSWYQSLEAWRLLLVD